MIHDIKRGMTITDASEPSELFSEMLFMIEAGELTGNIDNS